MHSYTKSYAALFLSTLNLGLKFFVGDILNKSKLIKTANNHLNLINKDYIYLPLLICHLLCKTLGVCGKGLKQINCLKSPKVQKF